MGLPSNQPLLNCQISHKAVLVQYSTLPALKANSLRTKQRDSGLFPLFFTQWPKSPELLEVILIPSKLFPGDTHLLLCGILGVLISAARWIRCLKLDRMASKVKHCEEHSSYSSLRLKCVCKSISSSWDLLSLCPQTNCNTFNDKSGMITPD